MLKLANTNKGKIMLNKIKSNATIVIATIILAACSTPAPQGELSSTANPREEISKMASELTTAQESNIDVLARDSYKKSRASFEKAENDLANNKPQEKIIDDLRFSKSFLKEAYGIAEGRKDKVPGLFEARQNAIKAGAAKYPDLQKEWKGIDEDVADNAKELDTLSSKKISDLQTRYLALEGKATFQAQLGNAQAQYNGARKDGAARKAPETFRKAELSLKNAESVIAVNVRNPSGYQKAVEQANADATLLSEVTETQKQNGKNFSETAALKMVAQKHQISDLKNNLSVSESHVAGVSSELDARNKMLAEKDKTLEEKEKALTESGQTIDAKNSDLAAKNKALTSAESTVALQKAIEKSRSQFSTSEAEAYQQGANLLIRLKSMNFASGKAELPVQSLALLAKVSEVAKSLNAKEIKVEGHTDSVGTGEINKKLSEERANAVATYFKANGFDQTPIAAEGHGFENPIATNKSKDGRAKNRRVDVIITPNGTTSINQ